MDLVIAAAAPYLAVTIIAVGFQLALAASAPWGGFAMAGRYPGRFPAPLRVAAVVQAFILALLAAVVVARAGVAFDAWASVASWLVWVVVAFSALSLVLNAITPSQRERRLWVPVAVVLLGSSLIVAFGG